MNERTLPENGGFTSYTIMGLEPGNPRACAPRVNYTRAVTVRVLMVETETVLHLYIIFVVGTSSGGLPSPPESAEDVVSTNECAWNQSLMC